MLKMCTTRNVTCKSVASVFVVNSPCPPGAGCVSHPDISWHWIGLIANGRQNKGELMGEWERVWTRLYIEINTIHESLPAVDLRSTGSLLNLISNLSCYQTWLSHPVWGCGPLDNIIVDGPLPPHTWWPHLWSPVIRSPLSDSVLTVNCHYPGNVLISTRHFLVELAQLQLFPELMLELRKPLKLPRVDDFPF